MQAELIHYTPATLGEGPVWDHRTQQLIWVDIEGCRLHLYDPVTETDRYFQLEQMVGVAVPTQDEGKLLLGLADGLAYFELESRKLTYISKVERELPQNRFNDGKCDGAGRFWAGTMGIQPPRQGAGNLYCLHPDLSLEKKVEGATISNGLAWTADGKTMYYVDTPTMKVVAYDFDLSNGNISNERTVIEIPDNMGMPDGMTIDENGHLWIALWGGFGVGCWDPASGKLLEKIEVAAPHTSSCTFGGPDLDYLFITTARSGLSGKQLGSSPLSGSLFGVKLEVKGREVDLFG